MRWNPINDRRREQLLIWLNNALIKRGKQKDYDWFVKELDEKISWVDPTPKGSYTRWVLYQLVTNRLSPEDYEKTHNTLKSFRKLKSRLPSDLRDINKYHNYGAVFDVVTEYSPKSRDRSKQKLLDMSQEIVFEDAVYTFIKITTPEAAVTASKNTGWCTCNKKYAVEYLKTSPLYIVFKYNEDTRGDERFLLVHQGTNQVMLLNNEPYSEYDPYLMEIFKTYLPELYCPNHEPNGELRNKLCSSQCNTGGCCDEMTKCADCRNMVCTQCEKQCKTCEHLFCEDCIVEECHNADCGINGQPGNLCKTDYDVCECNNPMCVDHQEECDTCGTGVCSECAEHCYQCNSWSCPDHYFDCTGCNEDKKCESCVSKDFMSDFGEFNPECHLCGDKFCAACLQKCDKCGKLTCDDDYDEEISSCSGCEEEEEEEEEDDWGDD